ncbi:hypothetical protein PQR68_07555 [Paraburkholderia agricolaris]|uniref:hypothetical protein n=1 Tax=Paraburkholderia agricolaris TaxID=2152888 RepID=UPI0038BC76B1
MLSTLLAGNGDLIAGVLQTLPAMLFYVLLIPAVLGLLAAMGAIAWFAAGPSSASRDTHVDDADLTAKHS